MIGRLLSQGEPLVVLSDAGQWEVDPAVSAGRRDLADVAVGTLRAFYDLEQSAQPGDHHLPSGVALLGRAAAGLALTAELAQPVPPLPAGAIA